MALSKKTRLALGIGAALVVAGGLAANTVIHQAKETAEAYLYGYPLVMMEVTKQHQMLIGTSAMNHFNHSKRFPDPGFNGVVSPNVDTLYSISHFDLRSEPLVLEIPDTSGQFYMMQILDAWTNVTLSPGTRTIGSHAKTYLIAGPGWSGEVPAGMELVHVPTRLAWMIGRIRSSGEAQYQQVTALQEGFKLTPLSTWQGKAGAQAAAVALVNLPTLGKSPAPDRQVASWSQEQFFNTFCQLLKDNPPAAADAPMMERIKAIGVLGTDCKQDLSPLQKLGSAIGYRKVVEAIDNSQQFLERLPTQNGWRIAYDIGQYGTRYDQRAVVAKIGLGANLAADAIYPNLWKDQDGQPLSGEHRYVLHFAKDQLPPVKGFWSLTLYNAKQFLSDNPLNRYALSDGDPLHYNADGSLDLYVQHAKPEQAQQSNWLPAPEQGFNLFLRLYWPQQAALDKQWIPPAIQRLP
ncbi:DUF1254 domain-containing protein [Pseudomonas sp. CAN2814]|uniref:DUF1254 domain-containing protein n=1 Tax=Pseudomonas sp. CAN1 TaxID=3046726 RepID=UPI00264A1957|nr:DUF1254 domain-containing protein [Pseudomonas sp. CAN1]MDN6859206.1 DUF1254 domain-containing protein [Pseudomonas sp. CAN1]